MQIYFTTGVSSTKQLGPNLPLHIQNNPRVCVRGHESPIDQNLYTLFTQVALFLGMRVRLFQSRLDVLAGCDNWVLWGKFL